MTFLQKIANKRSYSLLQWIYLGAILMIWIGMVGARGLISIGSVLFLIIACIDFWQSKSPKKTFIFLVPVAFFVLLFWTISYSSDLEMWGLWARLKLPFLIFPIAFLLAWESIAPIVQDAFRCLWIVMLMSSLFVLSSYLLHFKSLNESFFSGGTMPTPYSHIRYSLLLVISFFIVLFHQKRFNSFLLLYFFVFIHLLSVRSGIVALYGGIVVYVFYIIFQFQNWKKSLFVLCSTILLAVGSYSFFPSIKNKLSYMRYDISQWQEGKIDGNSDAMRISSLIAGIEIAKENIWIGVGAGDILKEAKEKHKQLFPNVLEDQSRKMPHNEFLWTLCVSGIIGLCVFFFAWVYPIFYFRKQLCISFIIIQIVFAVSFMVEYTLEEQIGGTLFILLFLLYLSLFNHQKCPHSR